MTPEHPRSPEARAADEPLDGIDVEILAALRDLHTTIDPVPSDLATEIKFRLTVQALHAEVAELQRSAPAELAAAAVRADEYAQTESMTFTGDQLSAMNTITALDAEAVRVDGWVTTDGCAVELRVRSVEAGGAGPVTEHALADADGRFTFARVRKGMAQFVFRAPGPFRPVGGVDQPPRPVITPHVEI